jgi:hypothetical protein
MDSATATAVDLRSTVSKVKFPAWLPLVILPISAVVLGGQLAPWILMWALALSIFAGLKWLSFVDTTAASGTPIRRRLAYLFLWPGMDAKSFLGEVQPSEYPALGEWFLASTKVVIGVVMVVLGVLFVDRSPILSGWVGGVGILFVLHFGLFHLLSLAWRRAGIDAVPIMNAPILASSLSDFWGKRWNLAFRDLAHTFVFRPSVSRLGIAGATMAVFLVSGIVHDVVISIPAGAGFGLPTFYFVIQGAALLFERSQFGKRLGLGKGVSGRAFCAVVTLGPVFLLFHRPFIEQVIVPMLTAFGSL